MTENKVQQGAGNNIDQAQRIRDARQQAQQQLTDVNASVAVLRTEADRARGLFGIGRRILVPADEIHVVVGDGRHSATIGNTRKVFGQAANKPVRYWLNRLTQVIKLKTVSFTVNIDGQNKAGIEMLDSGRVSFRLSAHAVAKLAPEKAEIAAQRVGTDARGLVTTIAEVGTAELIAAAATMPLGEIIANRQKLAEIAFPKVNQILSELGYDLALLTVTNIDGVAYQKLVTQSEARVSKETSIATNREQLAELQDDQGRQREEAAISAATEKKLASERLEREREIELATLGQQETLAMQRHEFDLKQIDRDKAAREQANIVDLRRVKQEQDVGEAEAVKQAQLARLEAEREASIALQRTEANAAIALQKTQTEAERMALEQEKAIEREARKTEAEALRLKREEVAMAERLKEIQLTEAEAAAEALRLKVDAETQVELIKANTESEATEKRAQAAKVRAEATRAEAAAPGLAEAEVAQAQADAEAERMRKLKAVEIEAQQQLSKLYEEAPVLVELEKLRMAQEHSERLAAMQTEAQVRALEALAPGININVYGNGGQAGKLLADVMSIGKGLSLVNDEFQLVSTGDGGADGALMRLQSFVPYIQTVLSDVNPRMLTTLKVADVVERLEPVVSGKSDLTSALQGLRNDAGFRVIGDMPVAPVLKMLGISAEIGDEEVVVDAEA